MSVIGVDLGSSTVKAGLFSSKGDLLAMRVRPVATKPGDAPGALASEADPASWTDASYALLRELSALAIGSFAGDPLEAIAIGGNGPTLLGIDSNGRPAMPALLWTDRRAVDEAAKFSGIVGRKIDPAFYLPKALWLKRNAPAVYESVASFMPCPEYLAYSLTGEVHSVLAAPGYEPFSLDGALASALGLDRDKFPHVLPPAALVGGLTARAAEETGLPRGLKVAAGLPDFLSALLGSGVTRPGLALDRSGSSEALNLCAGRPFPADTLFSLPHPAPGLYNVSGGVSTAGSALEWLLKLLGSPPGPAWPEDRLIESASRIARGAEGLLFLPYLSGERAPLWDPLARGAFVGLRMPHGPAHLVRALLESVSFALRDVKEAMEEEAFAVDEIRCSGGPSRSALWTRIKADVLGKPITVPESSEAEVLGSAAVALVAAGRAKDLIAASDLVARPSRVVDPDMEAHARYEEPFALFIEARTRLSGIHRRLSSIAHGGH